MRFCPVAEIAFCWTGGLIITTHNLHQSNVPMGQKLGPTCTYPPPVPSSWRVLYMRCRRSQTAQDKNIEKEFQCQNLINCECICGDITKYWYICMWQVYSTTHQTRDFFYYPLVLFTKWLHHKTDMAAYQLLYICTQADN